VQWFLIFPAPETHISEDIGFVALGLMQDKRANVIRWIFLHSRVSLKENSLAFLLVTSRFVL